VIAAAQEADQPERVPVRQPPPARVDLRVQPGPDQVTLTGGVAVPERDLAIPADLPAFDPPVPD